MVTHADWRGLKISIIGAAREGTALARYLAQCGAQVTLHDTKPASALTRRVAGLDELEALGVCLALGAQPADLLDTDVLFLSPGVPPTAPIVRAARERGVPISSEPRLFTQSFRSRVVGITGSSGKTTTTTLVGLMFAAAGKRTWVGGNIGAPLTERLFEPTPAEIAVMELSSFQLELFAPNYQGAAAEERRSAASRVLSLAGWSPSIAAITNITPNHLDRHPSMEDYALAKSYIVAFQHPGDWAILNRDNALCDAMATRTAAHVLRFSLQEPVEAGAYLQGNELVLRFDGREEVLCAPEEVKLRGEHNLANILCAACCAAAGGVGLEVMREVATTFAGVAHRLEVVRIVGDVTFVNDSIATSPERAMAALRAYHEPVVLLAGGRDKHLPWAEWADLVRARARAVVAFGDAVPIIAQALSEAQARRGGAEDVHLECVATLDEAVAAAARLARAGEVVLLSPGGTSFDAFEDFEARGQRFRELVAAL
jgi:UDP-N-acetylmuramoylalanine--D-glutamate ligase